MPTSMTIRGLQSLERIGTVDIEIERRDITIIRMAHHHIHSDNDAIQLDWLLILPTAADHHSLLFDHIGQLLHVRLSLTNL